MEQTTLFMQKPKTTDDILEAAEYCVNILEGAEMVPMWDAPSAKIAIWRAKTMAPGMRHDRCPVFERPLCEKMGHC